VNLVIKQRSHAELDDDDQQDPARGSPARVLVAVQQRMMAEVVAHRLSSEDDVEVVETTWRHAEVIPLATKIKPDVVVLDIKLVEGEITRCCNAMQAVVPDTRMAVITGPSADRYVMEAVEAGVNAFAAVDKSDAELLIAVRAASAGTPHLHPELVAGLMKRMDRSQRHRSDDLTARELEVLALLAGGLGNAVLAERLGVSINTVRHHVQSILTKLGVHTKLQAVTMAMREGLILPDAL
jgi:DNA-binding NarL/FixJ family response regulator